MYAQTLGAGMAFGANIYNNEMAREREHEARYENYQFGEAAAGNADRRTRALYNDLQSPKSMLQQYKDAGLSPSLMFGDGGAGSIGNGAQGNGAQGVNPNVFGVNALEAAQIGLLEAQTRKTNQESENINKDTSIKQIEENLKTLELGQYKNAWQIINSTWKDGETGQDTSIFEIARNCLTYDQFIQKLRNQETDESIKQALTTEAGQETARGIFIAASQFHRDIMILSSESVNADFERQIAEKLSDTKFAELNAEAAIIDLQKTISTGELDTQQAEAWNNMLKRLEKTNPTMHDIVIILGMIVNNALSNYRMPTKVNYNNSFNSRS